MYEQTGRTRYTRDAKAATRVHWVVEAERFGHTETIAGLRQSAGGLCSPHRRNP